MSDPTFDIAIIGGGIVGCAIARDAAGRGLSVFLCEQGDLGGGASSNTGRTLAEGATALSRTLRREREILLRTAPHAIRPLRVVMPLPGGPRSQLRRLGALAEGRRRSALPSTRVDLIGDPAAADVKGTWRYAEAFFTCSVDDARLVVLNALDAKARGARIEARTRCIAARREGWFWKLTLESISTGGRWNVVARTLVNAAGAQVGEVLQGVVKGGRPPDLRMVKRSWIMVPRLFPGDGGYAFQRPNGGAIFAIPHERTFTLIGPAEVGYAGDPAAAPVSMEDIDGILDAVNPSLVRPVRRAGVAWTYAGLCALRGSGNPSAVGEIEPDMPPDLAPMVSVFGASMAAHRLLAETAVAAFRDYLEIGKAWTADVPLPGGHFPVDGIVDLVRALRAAYPFVAEVDAERMVHAYGTRAVAILSGARRIEDLGRQFGAGLSESELGYLMKEEWATNAADVLWRRTKLGLRFTPAETAALDQWMEGLPSRAAAPAA